MNRKLRRIIILFLLALGLTAGTLSIAGSQEPLIAQCMMHDQGGMGGWSMGGNWEDMQMGGNWEDMQMGGNREDMQMVHQLFANHNQIRRTVEEIPGGVRTVTESDNPQVAALLQQHVGSMHQRLERGQWFAMMSRTLPIMFQNANAYQRESELIPNGIIVTKTSDNPDLVPVLREHSREVSGYVEAGMPCMDGDDRMRWW